MFVKVITNNICVWFKNLQVAQIETCWIAVRLKIWLISVRIAKRGPHDISWVAKPVEFSNLLRKYGLLKYLCDIKNEAHGHRCFSNSIFYLSSEKYNLWLYN